MCSKVSNIALPDGEGDDECVKHSFGIIVKEEPDLRLSDLTLPPMSPAETLPSRSSAAVLRPRLSSISSSCTSIQSPPKRSSRDNAHTTRKSLEKNLSRFLNDATKPLQKMGSMEYFMLSIAADVEKFDWSAKKILKYKSKVSQLTLEMQLWDSD